ncbi:MAG: DUF4293 family protein [Balneolaceae bacterium]
MIQRLQTVFLLLAAVINFFVFFTPIYTRAMQDPAVWIGIVFSLLLAGVIILSIYSVFLYRDREKQLVRVRIATFTQTAVLAASIAILLTLGGIGSFLLKEALSVLLILLALISLWQAWRFIRKDQELVESMDRIR